MQAERARAATTVEGRGTALTLAPTAAAAVGSNVLASDRLLPVGPLLQPLLPAGGLQRGTTVAVLGSTSLALSLVAAGSSEGSWAAAVGMPRLGMVAVAEAGICLERFVLVPSPPSDRWAKVVASLVDALDLVVLAPPTGAEMATAARRLGARARERGAVLIVVGAPSWPAELRLRVAASRWYGLGRGHGHLRWREVEVVAEGRGRAARQRRATVALAG